MARVELDPERGRSVAARLRALGVKGILVKAAEQGYITELACKMSECFCPEELGGVAYFEPVADGLSDWSPTHEHFPIAKADGGHRKVDNAILAHRLCNRIDYSIRVGRGHARDLERVRKAREEGIRRKQRGTVASPAEDRSAMIAPRGDGLEKQPVSKKTRSVGSRGIDPIAVAMRRLCDAERARREAIDELRALGAVRSNRLVGDLGEALAARFYGVALAENANHPGYDLETADGRRVQVRTLRSPLDGERTIIGVMKDPYDTLFAIKLTFDFEPLRAIEVPRAVLERHYPHGVRASWTVRLEDDPGVRRVSAHELGAT